MFTAIHKHYSLEEWKLFAANHPECLEVHFSTVNCYGLLLCSELTYNGVSREYCCQVRFWGMKIFAVLKFINGSGLSCSKRTAVLVHYESAYIKMQESKVCICLEWKQRSILKEKILCASVAVASCGSS